MRQAARALAPVATLAPALLLVASAFDGAAQIAIWIAALLFDYVSARRCAGSAAGASRPATSPSGTA